MPKIELHTDDPASHRCANCGRTDRPVTIVVGSRLYCSNNCVDHMEAGSMVGALAYSINDRRGAAPEAIDAAEQLLEHLKKLEPAESGDHQCPRCWRQMQQWGDGSHRCSIVHRTPLDQGPD